MRRFFTDRTSPSPDALAQTYDRFAATWLQRGSRLENLLATEAWRNDLTRQLQGEVLEISMAAGDTLIRLSRYDHRVTSYIGVDISPAMVAQAREAATRLTIPTTLQAANAEDLSMFADDQFDTVTASLVFCTIPDVSRALAEIARVCKPDGRIVLIEHVLSPNPVIAPLMRFFSPFQIRAIGCHLDRTTADTLQEHGFRIQEQRQRLFGVMRFLIAYPPVSPD